MKPSYSEQHLQKPSNQKLRKSTFFHQSGENTSFYRVNTISDLQRKSFTTILLSVNYIFEILYSFDNSYVFAIPHYRSVV